MKANTFLYQVLAAIAEEPGITAIQLARALRPKDDAAYGWQRKTSSAVASLRRRGWVKDVAKRCGLCGSAQTRATRNVPLNATKTGLTALYA